MKAVKSLICTVVLILLTGLVIWMYDSGIRYAFDLFFPDLVEALEWLFGVIFGVLAIVCAISTVIYTVLALIRKFTKFRPEPSSTAVFLASNLTLLAISGVIIFYDILSEYLHPSEFSFLDFRYLITHILLCSVVPVCVICTIICIVILVRRRKRS